MNQDQERIHDAYAPVHIPPLVPGRCAEALIDADGYARCHRADHGPGRPEAGADGTAVITTWHTTGRPPPLPELDQVLARALPGRPGAAPPAAA